LIAPGKAKRSNIARIGNMGPTRTFREVERSPERESCDDKSRRRRVLTMGLEGSGTLEPS